MHVAIVTRRKRSEAYSSYITRRICIMYIHIPYYSCFVLPCYVQIERRTFQCVCVCTPLALLPPLPASFSRDVFGGCAWIWIRGLVGRAREIARWCASYIAVACWRRCARFTATDRAVYLACTQHMHTLTAAHANAINILVNGLFSLYFFAVNV